MTETKTLTAKRLFALLMSFLIIASSLPVSMLMTTQEAFAADTMSVTLSKSSSPYSYGGSGLAYKYTFEACGYKLIVTVVMTALIVFFLPIDPLIKAIMVLGTAFPTATTVCMLTEQAGLNEKAATRMMFMSTVLSIPTIPIVVKLINMFIM